MELSGIRIGRVVPLTPFSLQTSSTPHYSLRLRSLERSVRQSRRSRRFAPGKDPSRLLVAAVATLLRAGR